MKAHVLVTGGAGYIGSHMARALLERGHRVTVLDNLSTGHRDATGGCEFIEADLREIEDTRAALGIDRFDLVMHFAASCYVGESVSNPGKYYVNNIVGSLNLLEAMRAVSVSRLVFSSSCATYGEPVRATLDESHPQLPVNPYGFTKLVGERMMAEYCAAHGFDVVALRYFNAAGCHPAGDLGERHEPETHLIPLALREAMRLRRGGDPDGTTLCLFGEDFPTPDGTCIRDYVHVADICDGHLRAMDRILGHTAGRFEAFNLGTGRGASVKDVIEACRRVTGLDIRYKVAVRRPGDPARLVASNALALQELGWKPAHTLDEAIASAWHWCLSQD